MADKGFSAEKGFSTKIDIKGDLQYIADDESYHKSMEDVRRHNAQIRAIDMPYTARDGSYHKSLEEARAHDAKLNSLGRPLIGKDGRSYWSEGDLAKADQQYIRGLVSSDNLFEKPPTRTDNQFEVPRRINDIDPGSRSGKK